MKCPSCQAPETKVVDTRINQSHDMIRRRRKCALCEDRFTTYERIEEVMPFVTKKDGRREAFVREKILSGIQKACQKRDVATSLVEAATTRIERKIRALGWKEVSSKQIGQLVMDELRSLDKVAYIRFASVYRDFKDVEDFVADLQDAAPFEAPVRFRRDETDDLTGVTEESLFFPFAEGKDISP